MRILLSVVGARAAQLGAEATRAFGPEGGVIGRSPEADWVLTDPNRYLSLQHARISWGQGGFFIEDLSSNGTYLNGAATAIGKGRREPLSHGDRLGLGDFDMIVGIEAAAPLVAAPSNTLPAAWTKEGAVAGAAPATMPPQAALSPAPLPPAGLMESASVAPVTTLPQATPPLMPLPHAKPTVAAFVAPSPMAMPPEPPPAAPSPTPLGLNEELSQLLAAFGATAPPSAPPPNWPIPDVIAAAPPLPAPMAVMPSAPLPAAPLPAALMPMPGMSSAAAPLPTAQPPAPAPMAVMPSAPLPAAPSPASLMPIPGMSSAAAALPAAQPPAPVMPLPQQAPGGWDFPAEPLSAELAADLTQIPMGSNEALAPREAIPLPRRAAPAPSAPPSGEDLAFWRGLGIDPATLSPEARSAALEAFGRAMRSSADGLVALLGARRVAKSEFDLDVTQLAAAGNNIFKFSPSGEVALRRLLAAETGFVGVDLAVARAFDDLRAHEVATAAGVKAALDALLERLAPAAIERRFAPVRSGLLKSRKTKLWELYSVLHAEIAEGAESRFQDVFQSSFARAYGERARQVGQAEKP